MKPAAIAVIGVAGVISVFFLEFYLPALIFLLNVGALFLIMSGVVLPLDPQVRYFSIREVSPGSFLPESPCLQGKKLDPAQDLPYTLPGRSKFLAGTAILDLWLISWIWRVQGNPFRAYTEVDSARYIEFVAAVLASAVALNFAVRWLFERRLLARSAVAMATLDPQTGGYNFCDQEGNTFGGTRTPSIEKPMDNCCLVFYAPERPDKNVPSSGLLFHRLVIHG